MRIIRVVAVIVLVGAAACSSKKAEPEADGGPVADPSANSPAGDVSALPEYNLGDVEMATRIALQVAPQSLTPTVAYEELGTLREKVAVANAVVKAPRPAEFWLKSTIESKSAYPAEDTVYLKVEVKADGAAEPLAAKTYVVSGKDLYGKPQTFEINLLEKLNPVPDSVLVQTYLTIVWFPSTSPMSVDAANPDISKGQVQQKLGNPLRIDFE